MARLFEPGYVYPSDREGGCYLELEGDVIAVDDIDVGGSDLREVGVTVRTDKGEFRGFTQYPRSSTFHPQVGHRARIRVYDIGGGWYPDHRITGFWTRTSEDSNG